MDKNLSASVAEADKIYRPIKIVVIGDGVVVIIGVQWAIERGFPSGYFRVKIL